MRRKEFGERKIEGEREKNVVKMEIVESAPTKIIMCGEHFVVYGAPAIAFPTEVKNAVRISTPGGAPSFIFRSGFGISILMHDGSIEGEEKVKPFAELAKSILDGMKERVVAEVEADGAAIKGMGNSASIAVALCRALAKHARLKLDDKKLFDLVQECEMKIHGGRASGIDARTVIANKPQIFQKSFKPTKFKFTDAKLSLPKDTALLIIDTYAGRRNTTAQMNDIFAAAHGIRGAPERMGAAQRKKLLEPYLKLYKGIERELRPKGNAEVLGRLMLQNHRLLASVGTPNIERAVMVALKAGALGAKITGAGGEGGAVIALVDAMHEQKVLGELAEAGYRAYEVLKE